MDWYSLSSPALLTEIGKRLKECRLRKNYSQNELAFKTGISVLSIQNLEKGRSVSLSTFIAVLRMLKLLENIDSLIPEPSISPIELMKFKGKIRLRAKKKTLDTKL